MSVTPLGLFGTNQAVLELDGITGSAEQLLSRVLCYCLSFGLCLSPGWCILALGKSAFHSILLGDANALGDPNTHIVIVGHAKAAGNGGDVASKLMG